MGRPCFFVPKEALIKSARADGERFSFQTAVWEQKIRRSAADDLFRVSLGHRFPACAFTITQAAQNRNGQRFLCFSSSGDTLPIRGCELFFLFSGHSAHIERNFCSVPTKGTPDFCIISPKIRGFEGFFPGGPPPFSTGQIGGFSVYCKKDFPNSQESSVLFPWESETATGGIALWT